MYARWKNRSGGWTKLFIMIKAFEVSCPILKDVFPEHEILKNSLYNKIKNTKDVGWFNHKDGYNDRIHRTDWPIADDFKREWVKELIQPLYNQLNKFALTLGNTNVIINKVWYQTYKNNHIHNWHTHHSNFTGVYYLKMPTINTSTYTQFLYPSSLENAFSIEVQEGDMVFFPAYFIHRSPSLQSKEDEEKVIISWNLDFNRVAERYTKDKISKVVLS